MSLATCPLAAPEAAVLALPARAPGHKELRAGLTWARPIALAALLALVSGCSVCRQAWRTVVEEPKQYSYKKDREASIAEYRQLAERVWRTERGQCSDGSASLQYVRGFIDGFSEYVYAGGPLEPPPVPPPMFWNLPWRTPPGHEAAADWFAGYRHGARTAHNGGYRDLGIVHASFAYTPGYIAVPGTVATPTDGEPLPPALETEPLPSLPLEAPSESEALPPSTGDNGPALDDPDVALFKNAMLRRAGSANKTPAGAADYSPAEVLQMPDLRQGSN